MELTDLTIDQIANGYIETEFTYECIYCDFKTYKQEFIIIIISFIQL